MTSSRPNPLGAVISRLFGRNGAGATPRADLALFGKHPAFGSDHLESGLGRGADGCAEFKYRMYNHAVRELISVWADLPDEKKLPGFDHLLVAIERDRAVVLGRLITFGDAVGRADYPLMILCRLPRPRWCDMRAVADSLVRLQSRIAQEATTERITMCVEETQREIDAALATFTDAPGSEAHSRVKAASDDWPLADQAAIKRFKTSRTSGASLRVRLALKPAPALNQAVGWALAAATVAGRPVLAAVPAGEPWIDLIARPRGAEAFTCLRLSQAELQPLAA